MSLLTLEDLTLRFGGLTAVNDVCFTVDPKTVFAVIGPNGAGKTSVFNAITGIYEPTEGRVLFNGKILQRRFSVRTALGIVVIGVLAYCSALIIANIETLWDRAITANYVYEEAFPWAKAWADFQTAMSEALSGRGWIFPTLSALLGMTGALLVWKRSRSSPEVIAQAGISRTFQNIRLFHDLTVLDNVLLGMERKLKTGMFGAVFRTPFFFKERQESIRKAMQLLEFVELHEAADQLAGNLSYGHQRRLEIARALASEPSLLLLDEPAAGMNPSEAVDLTALIGKIRDRGVTVMLIEHHMRVVMGISDRIAVLDYGNKIAEGAPDAIKCDAKVIAAYLGDAP